MELPLRNSSHGSLDGLMPRRGGLEAQGVARTTKVAQIIGKCTQAPDEHIAKQHYANPCREGGQRTHLNVLDQAKTSSKSGGNAAVSARLSPCVTSMYLIQWRTPDTPNKRTTHVDHDSAGMRATQTRLEALFGSRTAAHDRGHPCTVAPFTQAGFISWEIAIEKL